MASDTETDSSAATLIVSDVDIYSSADSPWEIKEIQYWGLEPGSLHHVILPRSEDQKRTAPYNKIAMIVDQPEMTQKYRKMFRLVQDYYSKNRDNPQTRVSGQLSRGHFVVIRISPPTIVHGEASVDIFHRGRVLKKRDGYYSVYAFDVDESHNVTSDRIYWMRKEYVTLRPQVAFMYIDGFEFFGYSNTLKELMEERIEWDSGMYVIQVGDGKLKHHVTGQLIGEGIVNINEILLKGMWKNSYAVPELASCYNGRLFGKVVSAKSNGSLTFQFPLGSFHKTFSRYMEEIEITMSTEKFNTLFKDNENNRKKVTVDPNEIYIVPAPKIAIKTSNAFVRVVPCVSTRTKLKVKHLISCKLIDFNLKEMFEAGNLVLSRTYHKWLHLVPPQGVSARLINVKQLDVVKFFETNKYISPAAVCTISAPLENAMQPLPLVELYNDNEKLTIPNVAEEIMPLTPELFASGIAVPFENLIQIPSLRDDEEEQPFYYVDMGKLNAFLNPAGRAKGDRQELAIGKTIYFNVAAVLSHPEFTIQTVSATENIKEFTEQLSHHLNLPWIHTVESRAYDKREIRRKWHYAYACENRNEILRVKLVESPGEGVLNQMKLKVLLIDYAEYEVVPVPDIRLNIPLQIMEEGPQAVRVIEADFKEDMDSLIGKRCSAKITSITQDDMGMTILKLARCNVFNL